MRERTERAGLGRVEGSSLVADLVTAGTTQPSGVLVARVREGGMLRLERRSAVSTPVEQTLDFGRAP